MVGNLIALKLTIQRHTPSWKRRAGLLLAVTAVVTTWLCVVAGTAPARADILGIVLLGWLVGWVVGPILSSGAAVLRPEYFTLLPIAGNSLGFGLLAAVFVGVGAIGALLSSLALVAYAATVGGVGAVGVAIVAALSYTVLVVSLGRGAYGLLGAAMRSNLGVELAALQYGLLIAGLCFGWLLVSPTVTAIPSFLTVGFDGALAGEVIAWSPAGWPIQAVDAAAAGQSAAALGWLAGLMSLTTVTVWVALRMLRPYVGNRTRRRNRRPLGSQVLTGRRLLPSGPLGAVAGKELRAWWRDPWRSLEVRSSVWFGVFTAVFGAIAGVPEIAGFAGVAVALMIGVAGSNLYGQDGTGLWQLVVAQSTSSVRADVRGRQIGLAVFFGVPAFALSGVMLVISGAYQFTVLIVALLIALVGVGSGIAVTLSVVGVTPGVDPHRRVNANDAGENGFAGQIGLWGSMLAVAPTLAFAAVGAFGFLGAWFDVVTLLVALVNGMAGAVALGAVAVRRLETHLPETFARLRYPGTAAAMSRGSGILDWMSQRAVESAEVAAAAQRAKPRQE